MNIYFDMDGTIADLYGTRDSQGTRAKVDFCRSRSGG